MVLDATGVNMDRTATAVVLANAVIWAAVLLGAAFVSGGTDCFSQLSTVLGGGAAASVVIVGGGVRQLTRE